MSSQWSQLNQYSLALYTKHLPTYMCRHPTWGLHRLGSIGLHISPSTQILVYNCNTCMIPRLIDQSCETLINLIDQSIMFQFDQFGQLIKLVKLTKLIKLKHGWSNLVSPSIMSNFDPIWLVTQSFQTLIKFGWLLNHVKLWSNLVDHSIMSNFDQIWLINQSCQVCARTTYKSKYTLTLT